jgi:hypothetical protein
MGETPKEDPDLLGLIDLARRIDEMGKALEKRGPLVEEPTSTPLRAKTAYRAIMNRGKTGLGEFAT